MPLFASGSCSPASLSAFTLQPGITSGSFEDRQAHLKAWFNAGPFTLQCVVYTRFESPFFSLLRTRSICRRRL